MNSTNCRRENVIDKKMQMFEPITIGVCGYGYTGSSAIVDLLREYDDVLFPPNIKNGRLEFTIAYGPYGLQNLEYNIVKTCAKHIRGDSAIYDFKRLCYWLQCSYDRETGGKFSTITEEYINSLVEVEFPGNVWFHYNDSKLSINLYKAYMYIRKKIEHKLRRQLPFWYGSKRYIVKPLTQSKFDALTKRYVTELIYALCPQRSTHIMLDQPFSPNYPEQVFTWFDNPRAIVIDRDPRDIYLMVKYLSRGEGSFLPYKNVKDFVKAYKAIRVHPKSDNPKQVIRIMFEDLVYEYDETVKKIEKFLELSRHSRPKEFFNPEVSVRNTQMMDLYPQEEDALKYIEDNLAEFLFPFEKYDKVTDRTDLALMYDEAFFEKINKKAKEQEIK